MRTDRRISSPAFRYSPLVAALALALAPQANAATLFVTTTADVGTGSLRDAINMANANCASDPAPTIAFNIAGGGPFVISPSFGLPSLQCGTNAYSPTVDGYTQTGSSPNTDAGGFNANIPVIIDGSFAYGGCGLEKFDFLGYGGDLTVKGLEIRNFNYYGGGYGLCGNVRAFGNRIVNNAIGIETHATSTIGDTTPADRNVIGNNAVKGIYVAYAGSVSITNNFIGTLDGFIVAPNLYGIYTANSTSLTITGNLISGNSIGIDRSGGIAATISGNVIGLNAAGTAALPNTVGIQMFAPGPTTINGNNVISGNTTFGIFSEYDAATTISGNKIGVDASGTSALPNQYGIGLQYSYGGSISSNTVSGNTSAGISIYQMDGGVTLSGNMIGTNSAGTAAIPNGTGVAVGCSVNLTVNGNNVISGNSFTGVSFGGVDGSTISNNKIGVAADGVTPLGNGQSGIDLSQFDCSEITSNNTISGNTIAHNGEAGVRLAPFSGTGNTLSQNSIYDNAVKNININDNPGPLPNDPGDADTGPNNQQNWPAINSVSQGGGTTTINFTLDSIPNTIFHIEIFDNPAPGAPAGRTYRADTFLNTGPTGVASGSFTLGALSDHFSLTATNTVTGDTSEFSPIGSVPPTPAVTLSATSLNFGNVPVGSTSSTQSVTVSSVGNAPYVINTFDSNSSCYGGPFCSGGGFTCSTTCSTGTPYANGTSCSISAQFSPSFTGSQSTTIFLCDNAAGSPRSITLSGNGTVPSTLSISPTSWDFGSVLVGGKSEQKAFLISNNGTSPAPIGPVHTTGAFTLESTTCGSEVPAGSSCNANVAFAPTAPGFAAGDLVVPPASTPASLHKTAKAVSGGTSAALTGMGVQNAQLDMPSAIAVGAYTLGSPALSRTVTLTNSGNAVLTFSSITASAPFTVVNNCPLNLGPGQSCTVNVGFSSLTAGEFNGTLTVVSNAPGGSRAIPLTATAQLQPVPVVRVAPTFIGFGSRMIGTQSAAQRITVTNEGGATATLGGMSTGVDYLIASSTCGATLASQQTCFAEVVFRPLGFGPRPGQFIFTSNAATSPHAVDLLGTGCRPFSMSNRSGAASACAP